MIHAHGLADSDLSPTKLSSEFFSRLLEGALAHARELLREGKQHVKIADDSGHSISGDDLSACCRGGQTLTADLRAISN